MVCRGNGDGEGLAEVSALRMPSVVSRVRRYGEVKKWRVSVGRRRDRNFWPASSAYACQDDCLSITAEGIPSVLVSSRLV